MQNPFAEFLAAVTRGTTPAGHAVAAAFQQHLAEIALTSLPAVAQADWRRIAILFKTDPAQPIPTTRIAAIRSWPGQRIEHFLDTVRCIAASIDAAENERQHDVLRTQLQRAYL